MFIVITVSKLSVISYTLFFSYLINYWIIFLILTLNINNIGNLFKFLNSKINILFLSRLNILGIIELNIPKK